MKCKHLSCCVGALCVVIACPKVAASGHTGETNGHTAVAKVQPSAANGQGANSQGAKEQAAKSVRDSSALRFDSRIHDFGIVREAGDKVSHTFTFRNTGDEPVVIVSASSSCGCTVPVYTREPVLPNGEGHIEITFDPMNRAGSFDKEVTITTSERARVRLRITGNVVPRQRTVDELYPVPVGSGLRLEDNFHAFGFVEHGKSARTAVGFVNTSNRRLEIGVDVSPSSGHLTVDCPAVVEPNAKGEIVLAYELPADSRTYGTLNDVMNFTVDGRRSEAFISVTAIAVDNRDDMADNYAPKADFIKNVVKFGVVKRREKALTEYFTIENKGEAPLVVRAVECRNAGLKLSLRAGDTLGAGEKKVVAVTLRPSHCEYGRVVERIRIITNELLLPMHEVRVTAIIEE